MRLQNVDIAALIAGKKEAGDFFVRAAAPLVFSAVRRTLERAGRVNEAEDVVQQLFERLWRDDFRLLRNFDPGRAQLSTWLTVVANSTALDHLRRLKRVPEPRELLPEAEMAGPPPQRDPLPIPRNLLTPRQAAIMAMLYEQELDVGDIAELLGVTAQTVRSAHHKAITRLRSYFAEEFPELAGDKSALARVSLKSKEE